MMIASCTHSTIVNSGVAGQNLCKFLRHIEKLLARSANLSTWLYILRALISSFFRARCNMYILRLCYDVSVRLSVTEVHCRIIAL